MPRQPLRARVKTGGRRTARSADRAKNLVRIPYRNDNLSLNSLINRKKSWNIMQFRRLWGEILPCWWPNTLARQRLYGMRLG